MHALGQHGASLCGIQRQVPADRPHQLTGPGKSAVLKLLLDRGAEIDVKNIFGITPRVNAHQQAHYDCVQRIGEGYAHRAYPLTPADEEIERREQGRSASSSIETFVTRWQKNRRRKAVVY